MFRNIGWKIKSVAEVFCYMGIAISVVIGFLVLRDGILMTAFAIVAGTLLSWLGSLALYGFGELIEDTHRIAVNTEYLVSKKCQKERMENQDREE